MSKIKVYLDQNFISNLAKARAGRVEGGHWLSLYELLDGLVHNREKVACPASFFHQRESSMSQELAPGIEEVVTRLSWGLQLKPWQQALRFQVHRAMCRFLAKPEKPSQWFEAFCHDPDAPTTDRSVRFRGTDLLLHLRWQIPLELINSDKRIRERYPELMGKVKTAVAGTDFESHVEVEKRAFVDYHYLVPAKRAEEAFCSDRPLGTLADVWGPFEGGEWSILQEMWRDLGGERAQLNDFLASEHFKACPFLDIQSRLYAALLVYDPDRLPKPGDYYDTQIIATAMPHCDVLAIDSYMKGLAGRIGLDKKYGVQVFSARQADLESLLAFLEELGHFG